MKSKPKIIPLLLIIVAITTRLLPHPPNFVPLTATILFSSYYLPPHYRYFIPFLALLISDFFIGFYGPLQFFVYASYFAIALLGHFLKKVSIFKLSSFSLFSSLIFFLISNFGFWVTSNLYSRNLTGLINCYIQALPFFKSTASSDLLYTLIIFATYYAISRLAKKILPQKIFQIAF